MAQETVQATPDATNGGSEATNGNTKAATPVTFTAVKPKLIVEAGKTAEAVQFYKSAFAAEELSRESPLKRKADQELPLVVSAELKLGSAVLIVSDQTDGSDAPVRTDGSGCTFVLETSDVDGAVANAVKAGAKLDGEVTEGESGNRFGKLKDPYGYVWAVSSEKTADVEA